MKEAEIHPGDHLKELIDKRERILKSLEREEGEAPEDAEFMNSLNELNSDIEELSRSRYRLS